MMLITLAIMGMKKLTSPFQIPEKKSETAVHIVFQISETVFITEVMMPTNQSRMGVTKATMVFHAHMNRSTIARQIVTKTAAMINMMFQIASPKTLKMLPMTSRIGVRKATMPVQMVMKKLLMFVQSSMKNRDTSVQTVVKNDARFAQRSWKNVVFVATQMIAATRATMMAMRMPMATMIKPMGLAVSAMLRSHCTATQTLMMATTVAMMPTMIASPTPSGPLSSSARPVSRGTTICRATTRMLAMI